MAESHTRETNCVYVDTSLDTHLLVPLHDHETISDFKVKLCKEHLQCFPELGEIDISAVKVNRQNTFGLLFDYHLPDSMLLSMVFNGVDHNCWFVFVDAAVKVEKCELPSENCLNNELLLLEKDKNDSLLLDGYTKNHTLEKDLEAGVAEKTTKKRKVKVSHGRKSRKKPKVDLNQSSAAATVTASEVVATETESSPRKKLDDTLLETTRKEIEMGEKSVEDVGRVNVVSHQANHLDTNIELTTRPDKEKKKRKKKKSKDDINQSSAPALTTSNVESVAATPTESLPASGRENRGNPFSEATQKEIEMGEKSVQDGGIDKIETDDLVNHMENHLDTNTWVTTRPDDTNQTSPTENVETVDGTPASLPISSGENLDDSFAEASQKENELVQISIDDVGRDQIETDNLVSHTANPLDTVSEVTTRPHTEKKKRKRKNIKNVDAANVDSVDATPEASQKETETGEKIHDTVGCGKTIPSAADNIQTSNVEAAKSVKSTKKRKSKTPAEEDTLVVSSNAHNVEPIEAVDGEEPDNLIRNVSGSLQEKKETEENNASLEVADSQELPVEVSNAALEVAQSQELSVEVNNAALEETPLMNNPQDTESDASLLRKCSEVADDAEDKSLSKKSLKENADMGDNFGCSQNQEKPDQVAGGAKSKKEKKGLDLHLSGSSNKTSDVSEEDSDVTFMSRKLRKQSGRRNK